MNTKIALAIAATLASGSALAQTSQDFLVEAGYLSVPAVQTQVVETQPRADRNAAEAYLEDNGLAAPARTVVGHYVAVEVETPHNDAGDALLAKWGYTSPAQGTVGVLVNTRDSHVVR